MNMRRPSLVEAPFRRFQKSRRAASADGTLPSVAETVAAECPDVPMVCLRPHVLRAGAQEFVGSFGGDVLYAVKCNPDPDVLVALAAGGIRHFDAASPGEVRLVRQMFPDAQIHYMHPIKARSAIREAYHRYGVRDFVLDSADELAKILDETNGATDLGLIVRLALPKGGAVYDLSGKFGAAPADAVSLLQACRPRAARLGVSFHVGSQCMDPAAYVRAIGLAGQIVADAAVALDIFDVGGGFPVAYTDLSPPPLEMFMAAIHLAVARLGLPAGCRLWCEPGRALAAAGQSLVVRVQARKGQALYINDGVYGTLADAGSVVGMRFPVRRLPATHSSNVAGLVAFEFFGPTCDSADRMQGPFMLPPDTAEGDWIEIGQIGAYGTSLKTDFNGFSDVILREVRDRPLLEVVQSAQVRRRVA
jgi:ornithine decarboxylase